MAKTIAVTGKGGVGKTTFSALLVRVLAENKCGPILAVDADPNLNLDAALGVGVEETVGAIREEALEPSGGLPSGMSKAEYLRYRTREALVETPAFDLLAMGRPEGRGCYCYANEVLRGAVDQLQDDYEYVVIDCEAGLEHLSRRTTGDVDLMIILSDVTLRGLETVWRVVELTRELKTKVRGVMVVVNRVSDGLPPEFEAFAHSRGLTLDAIIPEDPEVRALDGRGEPIVRASAECLALRAIRTIVEDRVIRAHPSADG